MKKTFRSMLPILLLGIGAILPPEMTLRFPGIHFYAIFKNLLLFSGMMALLFALGSGVREIFRFLLRQIQIDDSGFGDGWAELLIATILGGWIMGWLMFLGGLASMDAKFVSLGLLIVAQLAFVRFQNDFYRSCTDGLGVCKSFWNESSRAGRSLIVLISVLLGMKLTVLFDYQTHGDSYLYHLRLSEIWGQQAKVGLVLENMPSGYALIVEHFYYIIFSLVGSGTEHVILSQIFHALAILLTARLSYLWLRSRVDARWAVIPAIILFSPTFTGHALLPKNDGFVLAIAMTSLFALWNRKALPLLMVVFGLLSVKVTVSISFAIIFLWSSIMLLAEDRQNRIWLAKVTVLAAGVAICGALPFYLNNLVISGNPLFPLLNSIFKSDFGPQSMESVVSEMNPFRASPADLFQSIGVFMQRFVELSVLLLAFIPALWRRSHKDLVILASQLLFLSISLLMVIGYFLSPFGTIENRHFWVPILLSLMAGTVAAATLDFSGNLKKCWYALMLVLAILSINPDVILRKFFERVGKESLYADFLSKKPMTRLLVEMNQSQMLQEGDKILAVTLDNQAYFLKKAVFLHKSLSYPVFQWDFDQWNHGDWHRTLKQEGVQYVIVDRNLQNILKVLQENRLAEIVIESDALILLRVS